MHKIYDMNHYHAVISDPNPITCPLHEMTSLTDNLLAIKFRVNVSSLPLQNRQKSPTSTGDISMHHLARRIQILPSQRIGMIQAPPKIGYPVFGQILKPFSFDTSSPHSYRDHHGLQGLLTRS